MIYISGPITNDPDHIGKLLKAEVFLVGKGSIAVVDGNSSPHKDKISALNKALYSIG